MSKLPRIHSWDIKESVGISLLSIRKMEATVRGFISAGRFRALWGGDTRALLDAWGLMG